MSVKSKTPKKIRKNPPIVEKILRYFDILGMNLKLELTKSDNKIKGTARPAEKIARSRAPFRAVAEVVAKTKIAPKIGPTQGVQPELKAAPKMKEVKKEFLENILG